MSGKHLPATKKHVNKNPTKSPSRNTTDILEHNINKHTSSISNKIADLKNGNYIDSNKTDDSKLKSCSKYGNQRSNTTSRIISYCNRNTEE